MIASVDGLVRSAPRLPISTSPLEELLNDEMIDFALASTVFARRTEEQQLRADQSTEQTPAGDLRRVRCFERQHEAWLQLKNAFPQSWAGDMVLSHDANIKDAVALIRALIFNRVPVVPSAGKWAKAWDTRSFFSVGVLFHRVLLTCMQDVFAKRQDKKKVPRKPLDGFDDLDDIDWGEINGVRLGRVREFVQDTYSLHLVFMYTLVMEPIVWLTQIFMGLPARCTMQISPRW